MLFAFQFLKYIFRHLVPKAWRYPAARGIGRAIHRFDARRRHIVQSNLLPLVGPEKSKTTAPLVFQNFAMTSADFFCPPPPGEMEIEVEGAAHLEAARKPGAKTMVVTAHVGNWELGMRTLSSVGIPLAGLYAPYRENSVVNWILGHRDPAVRWICAQPGAAEACLNALDEGRMLGLLADIPFGEKGRRVKIGQGTARLPLGPWAIAARANATVIPAFALRTRPGAYRIVFHEPLLPTPGSFRKQMERFQDRYRLYLEQYLMRYPEQWGLLQPFWETK